ncbi:tetratricopeptide (TPR) repeat protein [Kitasatospora sp. GP82]|nr:tetratricopeptide (TPR) repeat protein [Kitasatospora sp. GP82]
MAPVRPPRAFISYAHDNPAHVENVRSLYQALRSNGIDAKWDLPAAEQRQNWVDWMEQELRLADFILIVASPGYRRRESGAAGPDEGRGVQWESKRIADYLYRDLRGNLRKVLPVVLPGCSADDLPSWLNPASTTVYRVSRFDLSGVEKLIRTMADRPFETEAVLDPIPDLPPRDHGAGRGGPAGLSSAAARTGRLHLANKRYDDARIAFSAAVRDIPSDSEARYYLALALLAGRNIAMATSERISRAESCLQQVTESDPGASHAWALWAVLKEEHFISAGRGDGTPPIRELVAKAAGIDGARRAELLTHLNAPSSTCWRGLRSGQSGGNP